MSSETDQSIRVLIIEDNKGDAVLEIETLIQGGFDVLYERVETPDALKDALKHKVWDCILSDYYLLSFTALEVLTVYKEENLDIPFIVISGAIGEETAVEIMKAGVHDYIMKSNLSRLVPVLKRELREAQNRVQKRYAEESLRVEQHLLRILIDSMPDLINIKDMECRRIVANLADVKFAGYNSEDEIKGKTDLEIYPGEYGKQSHASDLAVLQSGKAHLNYEEEIMDTGGIQHWFNMGKIPFIDPNNNITGLICIAHDITERKKMESALLESEHNLKKQNLEYESLNKQYILLNEDISNNLERIKRMNDELTRSKNKAEESDRLKSAFLANMSHEIRTPLNAILGFSSFLKNKELSKNRTDEFVDIIEASGKQLLTTISDILEISQIVAGQITLTHENVNITKLLNELFIQFIKEASLKNLELILNINNSAEEIHTQTDASRIRQILSNLLNNAIKFTHEGKIEFAARIANEQVIFYVKDTGIGIDQEFQQTIFEAFRQVENTMSRNYGGNGLGLSISKALVEKLGGKMSISSIPKKGSTFTFTIPYNPEKKDLSKHKQPNMSGHYDWKNHVILVVEDEIYNYRYIEEILMPTSARVIHATNGREAVDMVKLYPDISVVIMDLKLPEMDGYKATEIIKELRPDLPVIAQTAFVAYETADNEKNRHFDQYLSKPIERKSFMAVIDNYLDG
jgi:PAS domain S-box-containing protein